MTICNQWAWKPDDGMKSLSQCIQTLVLCAGGDGNLLLNVGPMPTGEIAPRQVRRLLEMGQWLEKYGQSIYGTRGGPFKPGRRIASTRKGNTIFLHLLHASGDVLTLPSLPRKILAATLLTGGQVEVQQKETGLTIRVAPQDRRPIDTIVKLDLDGPAMEIRPVD